MANLDLVEKFLTNKKVKMEDNSGEGERFTLMQDKDSSK